MLHTGKHLPPAFQDESVSPNSGVPHVFVNSSVNTGMCSQVNWARWLINWTLDLKDAKCRPKASPPGDSSLATLASQICSFPVHASGCKFAEFASRVAPRPVSAVSHQLPPLHPYALTHWLLYSHSRACYCIEFNDGNIISCHVSDIQASQQEGRSPHIGGWNRVHGCEDSQGKA